MKIKYSAWLGVLMFVLAGCTGNSKTTTIPVLEQKKETTVVSRATRTLAPASSATLLPSPTITLTSSITPTTTLTPTPTVTPENFVLADNGFDIADVRLAYLSEEAVRVNFKYRIDANQKHASETIVIAVLLPACHGTPAWSLVYNTDRPAGDGTVVYRQATKGRCEVPFFDIAINFKKSYGAYNETFREVYRERIRQPIKVVSNLTPINSQTLRLNNFAFEATGPWSGRFTFDYVFSPEVSYVIDRYSFTLSGMSDFVYCGLEATGPTIAEVAGSYAIDIKIQPSRIEGGVSCFSNLDQFERLEFHDFSLSLGSKPFIYQHAIDFNITLKKSP